MGHSVQDCQDFLGRVQELMDEGRIEFCKEMKGQVVNVLQGEILKPVIIYYRGRSQQAPTKAHIHPIPKVVIKIPTHFRYTSDKAIPWNYTNQVVSQKPQAVRVSLEIKQEPSINDIVGTGRLTRSDRYYASGLSGVKRGEEGIEQSDVEVTVLRKKGKESLNKPVTKIEANEFLKFNKHSEYSIVEQLHKLPAKISLLALMLHSKPHREAILKVLK